MLACRKSPLRKAPTLTRALLSTSLFFAIQLKCYGIVILDTGVTDQQYIDLGNSFSSVGELASSGSIRGSGSLISETGGGPSRYVLTAAHLGTPNEFAIGGSVYNVTNFTRHPDYDNTTLENDIAIAELDTTLSGFSALPWHNNDGDLASGLDVTSVGFGRTGDGTTGEQNGTAGTKRGAQNTIDEIGSNAPFSPSGTHFEYRFFEPSNTDARELEGSVATFDSGGPVIADFGEGNTIVGVHSYVQNNDGGTLATYGDDTGSTRVPLFDSWITSQVPELSVHSLFLGLVALFSISSRRRMSL